MTLLVTTTHAADSDIRAIASYIAVDSPKSAREFGVELQGAFDRLSENGNLGHAVNINLGHAVNIKSALSLRAIRVSRRFRRYLIFYHQPSEQQIEILRILHGARDVNVLLTELKS